jgi:ankyrin repeat protein
MFTIKSKSRYLFKIRLISDADILRSIKNTKTRLAVRESRYDSNIKTLIPLMDKGYYSEVAKIIKIKNVSIDAHDRGENTLLTHAAKMGDIKAIKFLVTDMKANVHASCSCPYHKTALHYSSENGHYNIVQFLLNNGAMPNELDSRKYTALDVASTEDIKKLLRLNNGVTGSNIEVGAGQYLPLPKATCLSIKE